MPPAGGSPRRSQQGAQERAPSLAQSTSSSLIASSSSPELAALADSNANPSSSPPPLVGGASQFSASPLSVDLDLSAPLLPVVSPKPTRIQREVSKLAEEGTTHVILLLSEGDYLRLGVDKASLSSAIASHGMKRLAFTVPSGPMPVPLLIELVQAAISVLCDPSRENKLLVVSKSGFHRAGTLAACILCAFGLSVDKAVRIVREARGIASLGRESRDQLVAKFDAAWRQFLVVQALHSGQLFQASEEPAGVVPIVSSSPLAASSPSPSLPSLAPSLPLPRASLPVSSASSTAGPPANSARALPPASVTIASAVETPAASRSHITVWPMLSKQTPPSQSDDQECKKEDMTATLPNA